MPHEEMSPYEARARMGFGVALAVGMVTGVAVGSAFDNAWVGGIVGVVAGLVVGGFINGLWRAIGAGRRGTLAVDDHSAEPPIDAESPFNTEPPRGMTPGDASGEPRL